MLFRTVPTRMLQNLSGATTKGHRAASSFTLLRQPALRRSVVPAIASSVAHNVAGAHHRPMSTNALYQDHMFCRQCEQTKDHEACTTLGVCGKTSETAACQDALIDEVKSVAAWAVAGRKAGLTEQDLDHANVWTLQATFSTLTNVNFSDERIADYIREGEEVKKDLKAKVTAAGGSAEGEIANLDLSGKTTEELEEYGYSVSVPKRAELMGNEDAFCLNETAQYSLKGLCAYAAHCHQLGKMDAGVMTAVHEIYAKLASHEPDVDGLLAAALRVGENNVAVMAMLDGAHAEIFGEPSPAEVRASPVQGKAILVSGHDMADLNALLDQTEGTGVNVYTHGEMLPAHSYPKLRARKHLAGNFGTAWQNQKFEFASFPGPVIVTTNCIMEPRKMYKNRLYTMNEVGVDGVQHIGPNRDFSAVIEQAQQMKGFPKTASPEKFLTVGFNHRAVLPLAQTVLDAVAAGDLKHIFLIGGCDGSQSNRSYFTELAEATPDDSMILTLGCAKNRLIHSEKLHGATLANGLPRVLDMGQCNDSYSAVVVATELAKALDCTVNDLPLSLALSHLEQKAAAVLMSLLHLGVKNIRLGPSLPAYVTPNVFAILQKEYNLMGTSEDVQGDLQAMLAGK